MKTSVTMIRRMGDFEILQRTKDGYFDANALLVQWNRKNNKRRMDVFLSSDKTKEFIQTIQNELADVENCTTENQVVTISKGKKSSKGQEKNEVWMHPYLFIDFAMWINPKFKYSVIKFVYDELIKNRTQAGDGYVMLSASGVKLKGYNFSEVAKAIQWIVYNKTGKDLRQSATQEQLAEINDIQTKLAFAIDMGFIKSYEQLILDMRKMYRVKYLKSPF